MFSVAAISRYTVLLLFHMYHSYRIIAAHYQDYVPALNAQAI